MYIVQPVLLDVKIFTACYVMGRTEWNAYFVTKDKQGQTNNRKTGKKKEKQQEKEKKYYKCVHSKRWKGTF